MTDDLDTAVETRRFVLTPTGPCRRAHLPTPSPEPDDDEDEDDDDDRGSGGGNIDPEEDEGWSDDDEDEEDDTLWTARGCAPLRRRRC